MLLHLLALTATKGVEHETHCHTTEHEQKDCSHNADPLKRFLRLILLVQGIHFGTPLLMLIAYSHVLHVNNILLARQTVAELVKRPVVVKSAPAVVFLCIDVVVQLGNLRLVFERMQVVGKAVGSGEIGHRCVFVADFNVYLRKSETWFHGMPPVF